MKFAAYAALLMSMATSSLGYMINVPNDQQGWYSHYTGHIIWSRVVTDPEGFAVVLTNQDRSVLASDIILKHWVNGDLLHIDIPPPVHGFPIGAHFRVNFVKNAGDQETIFAQSNEFTIKP